MSLGKLSRMVEWYIIVQISSVWYRESNLLLIPDVAVFGNFFLKRCKKKTKGSCKFDEYKLAHDKKIYYIKDKNIMNIFWESSIKNLKWYLIVGKK